MAKDKRKSASVGAGKTSADTAGGCRRTGGSLRGKSTNTRTTANGKTKLAFRTIEETDFYHGYLPRADVDLLLLSEGDFLVRTTTQKQDAVAIDEKVHTLSVMWKDTVRHIIPKKSARGGYFLEKFEFEDVGALVKYYFNKRHPLTKKQPIMLLNPIPKPEWQLSKEQVVLEKKLGEGAFGEVHQGLLHPTAADKQQQPIKVAVKVTHAGTMTKTQLADFMCEARLMRNYNHRNIVQFLGVVVESEPIMIVMELVPGGSLDKLLVRRGDALELADRMRFCHGAASGLEYLHGNNCMHRDIAARNCLIGFGVVKISDFGLCRQQESVYKMSKRDKVPIRWLAPETLNTATYSFKSDVFSFGVLVWEVFNNGAEPYTGMLNADVIKKIKAGYRMPHCDKMPKQLTELLDQCWNHQQDKRPAFPEIVKAFDKMPSSTSSRPSKNK